MEHRVHVQNPTSGPVPPEKAGQDDDATEVARSGFEESSTSKDDPEHQIPQSDNEPPEDY